MSKTFELLVESLTEIIEDMEKTGGKNLTHRTLSADLNNRKKFVRMKPARVVIIKIP